MAQVAWIFHLFEQQSAASGLLDKVLDVRADALADDVVAQHDHHFVAVDEALAQTERFGDAARLRLIRKLQAAQAELAAVAEQRQELTGVVAAGDDHDLVDAG